MPRLLPTTLLLLYPLLAACGADSSENEAAAQPDTGPSSPSLTLSVDPCFLGGASVGGAVGDIEVIGLNLEGLNLEGLNLEGADFGGVVISGYSSQTEDSAYQSLTAVSKDGIRIGLNPGTIDGESIFIPENAEECEQPEYAYALADGLPDHDTGSFPNSENPFEILEQDRILRISLHPTQAEAVVELSSERFDGLLLNGVPIQMRESSCIAGSCGLFGPTNPLNAPSAYGIDAHNAHVLSDGSYHYHGDPKALYPEPAESGPTLIGVAADGYPIWGPWVNDGGLIRKATSSYHLKTGLRPPQLFMPSSVYDGTYIGDFEYVADSGDLDECNGMSIDGVYGYYVTDTFPYILNCFHGTPDPSFNLETDPVE